MPTEASATFERAASDAADRSRMGAVGRGHFYTPPKCHVGALTNLIPKRRSYNVLRDWKANRVSTRINPLVASANGLPMPA